MTRGRAEIHDRRRYLAQGGASGSPHPTAILWFDVEDHRVPVRTTTRSPP